MSQGRIPAWEIPREFWPQEFFGAASGKTPFFLESNPARIWNLDLRPNTLVATVVMPGKIGWVCFLTTLARAGAAFQRPRDCDDFWDTTLGWFAAQGCPAVQFLSERLQSGSAETSGSRIRLPKAFRFICDFQDLEWSSDRAVPDPGPIEAGLKETPSADPDFLTAPDEEDQGEEDQGGEDQDPATAQTPLGLPSSELAPKPISHIPSSDPPSFGSQAATATWRIRKAEPAGQESELAIATMEQSGDCPELAQIRSNAAAWESLLQVHGRTKECWTLQIASQPCGILLGYLPEGDKEGLVSYLGLIPQVRGKGWGKRFLRQFLAESLAKDPKNPRQNAAAKQITTMVDVRNTAARRLYESLGFRKRSQGQFHLAFLQPLASK